MSAFPILLHSIAMIRCAKIASAGADAIYGRYHLYPASALPAVIFEVYEQLQNLVHFFRIVLERLIRLFSMSGISWCITA